jgi:hypothetical protein
MALKTNNGPVTGAYKQFAGTGDPAGWLLCDGRSLLRSDYPNLFAVIGTSHGAADGTHFNVPDLRGRFPRGSDTMGTPAGAAGIDTDSAGRTAIHTGGNAGNQVGSAQGHAYQTHTHSISDGGHNHTAAIWNDPAAQGSVFGGRSTSGGIFDGAGGTLNAATTGITGTNSGAPAGGTSQASTAETRPINIYANFIIKI